MATKTICDVCNKGPTPENPVISGNTDFAVTNGGVYVSGSLQLIRDGQGLPADVCEKCMREILVVSELKIRQGTILKEKA